MDVFREQFDLLHSSGLYSKCNKLLIYISLYDNNPTLDIKIEEYDPDGKFLIFKSEDNLKEVFALNDFRNHIEDESYMFYFHSKGVSYIPADNVEDKTFTYKQSWRNILNFYTISKWKISLELLKKYDVVGCFLTRWPVYHFSGNFWWANINYVKDIPNCKNFYLAPEMFIGEHYNNNFICLTTNLSSHVEIELHLNRTDEDILKNINTDTSNNDNFWNNPSADLKFYLGEQYKETKYWKDWRQNQPNLL